MIKRLVEKVAECDSEQEMALRILFHTYKGFYHRLHIIAGDGGESKGWGPFAWDDSKYRRGDRKRLFDGIRCIPPNPVL